MKAHILRGAVMTPALQDLLRAEALGLKLEVMNGLPLWEAMPSYRHQKQVQRIASSIANATPGCACVHVQDVYVTFADGFKRPDISIFCREPDEAEQDSAVTLVPEVVIEVVSKGYEAKDLQLAPGFYLSQGVKDVVVFDPASLLVLHATAAGTSRLASPAMLKLACGCTLSV